MKRWGIIAVGASALLFAGALAHFCKARIVENWPPHVISPKFRSLGLAEAKRYRDGGYDASLRSQKYVAGNNYLNYGQTFNFRESAVLRFDAEGIPMQKASALPTHRAAIARLRALKSIGGSFRFEFLR